MSSNCPDQRSGTNSGCSQQLSTDNSEVFCSHDLGLMAAHTIHQINHFCSNLAQILQ
ncbi:Conserved hypothetical protein [Prochlorococcus marinus str. MIT 9313]|uniref:Uncharacterized protein n=1 Tax=Prochlorococcus marinus (strain MIT 9313) TaxID=74547 RepID=B9ES08_PROMM|nr:Conserved hypothetical protein [Prochlorococcus marinus str. MIT 9313]